MQRRNDDSYVSYQYKIKSVQIPKQIITTSSSSPEGLYTILKNSEKVIIDGGMCIFVITTSVSVPYGILAQMKCLKVI